MKKTVHLFYADIPNFGDQLSRIVLERLFDCRIMYAPVHSCDMTGIGSVLDSFFKSQLQTLMPGQYLVEQPLHVWGSGYLKPHKNWHVESFIRPLIVHALRGKLSRARIEATNSVQLDTVALGDPGLFARELLETAPERKYVCGIVPHYTHLKLPAVRAFADAIAHSTIISPEQPPETVIEKIAECDFIFGSSMHALIVADALNIPNERFCVDDVWDYKYDDYYSALDMAEHPKIMLNADVIENAVEILKQGMALYTDRSLVISRRLTDLRNAFNRIRFEPEM